MHDDSGDVGGETYQPVGGAVFDDGLWDGGMWCCAEVELHSSVGVEDECVEVLLGLFTVFCTRMAFVGRKVTRSFTFTLGL